jgi:hypothetical protein
MVDQAPRPFGRVLHAGWIVIMAAAVVAAVAKAFF